jgi:hypothetical protein
LTPAPPSARRPGNPSEPEPEPASHRQLRLVLVLILAITLLSPLLFDVLARA